ncbi:hypothetical protein NP493_1751g00003 [Ridgeia piscesae]|uniref:Uncharacterized protein n=1 Tax=Ridgeia piscesae TaxID=27915 RepID=A0AAD9JTH5_RIDPI|nr:hypothetical protein NP493_1751g00003 [Ridgeia piscesae]
MEKPQSAPAPVALQLSPLGRAHEKMKFKRGRSDATKEIERWAHIGGDYPKTGAMRNAGQLSFNVTEQRLLEAKVLDLSRARYRFKSQNQYDKYMFLERQRRKSSVFRDLLADVTTEGQRSARPGPAELLHKAAGARSLQTQMSRRSAPGRSSIHNTHSTEQILPDGSLAPRVSLSRISAPAQDTSTAVDRNKSTIRDMLPRSRSVVETPRDTHMQLLPPVGKQPAATFATERRDSDRKSNSDDGSAADGQLVPQRRHAYPLRKRDSRAPLADPRYKCLEGALSLNYVSQITTEIPALVRRVDSLHVQPTIQMPTKKKKSKRLSVKMFQLVAGMPLAL